MIASTKLGKNGRLGNQLFQYAYLRSMALKMGVKFYCPKWTGDEIFELKDVADKTDKCLTDKIYLEDRYNLGFDQKATEIKDGTDVNGFFQSEKYFISPVEIRKWFSFRKDYFKNVDKKYSNLDFSKTVAVHLRLGDYKKSIPIYYIPSKSYFKKALGLIKDKTNVLVFSDDIRDAQKYFKSFKENFIYIQGNSDVEDLYLMSKCSSIVCSASSYSWWGAYLGEFKSKMVVMPEKWTSPSSPVYNNDIFPDGCFRIKAHNFILDNFYSRIGWYLFKKNLNRLYNRIYIVARNEGCFVMLRNVGNKIVGKINKKTKVFSKINWAIIRLHRKLLSVLIFNKIPRIKNFIFDKNSIKISSRRDYKKILHYYKYRVKKFEDYVADSSNAPKDYFDLKFAVYFQCFNQRKATFETLKSFRNFYPEVKVHLLSDKGEDFSDIAKCFNCDYTYSEQNIAYWPCKDMIGWFKRLYETCLMYPNADWILLLEDDIRVRDHISKEPNAHIAGQAGGNNYNTALFFKKAKKKIWQMYPNLEINGYSGCGGTIFNRKAFIECFENIDKYNIDELRKIDERFVWATDISLTYLFHLNGFINRRWFDYSADSQCDYGPAAAFEHQFKEFYNKKLSKDEINNSI